MKLGLWMEAGSVVDHVQEAAVFEVVAGASTSWCSPERNQGAADFDYEWSSLPPARNGRYGSSIV